VTRAGGTSRRVAVVTTALLLASVATALAHDLFLKPVRYHVAENSEVLVRVLNGTFSQSENSIVRSRVRDIAVVSPAGRARVDTAAWTDKGDTSTLLVRTGAAGTYVIGASTTASTIALSAEDFNTYLRDDGIPDVLAARRRDGTLGKPARERYSKHIKSLIQVGARRSDGFDVVLGYPAELAPMANPYALRAGDTLRLRVLVHGNPVARQLVMFGGRTTADARIEARTARSDANGVVAVPLRSAGTWYVKFIHMAAVKDSVDYESNWASLTFEIR